MISHIFFVRDKLFFEWLHKLKDSFNIFVPSNPGLPRLNNIHIADMLLRDKSEVKLIIIYLTINQEKT